MGGTERGIRDRARDAFARAHFLDAHPLDRHDRSRTHEWTVSPQAERGLNDGRGTATLHRDTCISGQVFGDRVTADRDSERRAGRHGHAAAIASIETSSRAMPAAVLHTTT